MAKLIKLTHETLTRLLDYDPATGAFVWKVARSNRVKVGSRAGVLHRPSGGRYISIDDEKFMAHRLAFFYLNNRWPNADVRPLDSNYDNCAQANLREVKRVDLAHQRSAPTTNTSGYVGVSRAKGDKWQSKITWNYRQISLGGNFDTAEDASEAYNLAAEALKTATSEADVKSAVDRFWLAKRHRAAWANLISVGVPVGWASFEDFVADVKDIPKRRYAMGPIDATKPIGPGNYRWASAD